ncbi:MAG: cytochrome P450 [Aggregatilineales bacterium]
MEQTLGTIAPPAKHTLPPGPPPAKNFFQMLAQIREFAPDPLNFVREQFDTYGDIYLMSVAGFSQYNIRHPDDIHRILVTDAAKYRKDPNYKDTKAGLARFMGNGLVTSDGDFWKRQRRLVAPAFHTKRITSYAEVMTDYTQAMLNDWQDDTRLDVSQEMRHLTMRIVAKALFNTDVSNGDTARVYQAVEAIQEISGRFSLAPPWLPTPRELRGRRAKRDLDRIIYGLITERRATGEDNGDLLSMLLLARDDDGAQMSDEAARDEAVTLFLAGHETTSNALSWTWLLLAQYPEIEAKLHHELDTVLAGRTPTLADLKQLPYTEMVIKESMRLYPPVWAIGRQALEDVQISGYTLPKGSVVGVTIYFTHHDACFFPDPERFDPERFSPENEPNIPKYAYLPFSSGPRVCIGNSFAMMEAQLLLATIASRYTFRLSPGQKVAPSPLITLTPKGGLPMTIYARQPIIPADSAERVMALV